MGLDLIHGCDIQTCIGMPPALDLLVTYYLFPLLCANVAAVTATCTHTSNC